MLIVCLIVLGLATLFSGVALVRLSAREKRFPSPIFMIELVGRWGQIPADRRDPWVSAAVFGFLIAGVSMIGCIALAF